MKVRAFASLLACLMITGCAAEEPADVNASEGAVSGPPSSAVDAARRRAEEREQERLRKREQAFETLGAPLYDAYRAAGDLSIFPLPSYEGCAAPPGKTMYLFEVALDPGPEARAFKQKAADAEAFHEILILEEAGTVPGTKTFTFIMPKFDQARFAENRRLAARSACAESKPYKPMLVCRDVRDAEGPTRAQCGLPYAAR